MQLTGRNLEILSFWKPQETQMGNFESLGVTEGAAHGLGCKQGKDFPSFLWLILTQWQHIVVPCIKDSSPSWSDWFLLFPLMHKQRNYCHFSVQSECSAVEAVAQTRAALREPGAGHLPDHRFSLLPCSFNNCNFCHFPPMFVHSPVPFVVSVIFHIRIEPSIVQMTSSTQ